MEVVMVKVGNDRGIGKRKVMAEKILKNLLNVEIDLGASFTPY